MKRYLTWILVIAMLVSFIPAQPVFADGDETLTIHYLRPEADYEGWTVWLWAEGGEGKAYEFEGADEDGAYFTTEIDTDAQKYGYIIRFGEWEKKDVDADQFIDVTKETNIYITSGVKGYTASETTTGDIVVGSEQTLVRVHYHRYDKAYDGWNLWMWPEGGEGAAYPFTGSDDFGVYADVTIPGTKDLSQIGIIVRFGEWEAKDIEEDRYLKIAKTNEEGILEAFLVQADEKIYYDLSKIDTTPKVMKAQWTDFNLLELETSILLPEDVSTLKPQVTDHFGNNLDILSALRSADQKLLLEVGSPIDMGSAYTVLLNEYQVSDTNTTSLFDTDAFNEQFEYDGALGALYDSEQTEFVLWAPTAQQVRLNLYQSGHNDDLIESIPLEKGLKGTWLAAVPGDMHGIYYTYSVTVGTSTNEAVDPYAQAVGVNGDRGMVIDQKRAEPENWQDDKRPAIVSKDDAIVYEAHIRDLSSSDSSDIKQKGKFVGLTETGTATKFGDATGLDHLVDLGITHLQLLPIFDYNSLDETKGFDAGFNWGYDPKNYNAPEGTYATNAYDGVVRVKELKSMVQALHNKDIRIIMDVVYNHTALSTGSNFEKIVPGYYYRSVAGTFSNGSGCGNETASERAMMRKFIIDSTAYWTNTYHLDGFRFDLMGLHDIETMNLVADNLMNIDDSILVYGEGWTGGSTPLLESMRLVKVNAESAPKIGVFNDDVRDGIKGHVFTDTEPGFVNGGKGFEESVKFGVVGAIQHDQINNMAVMYAKVPYASSPLQSVNYVSAHDNLTLRDKLAATLPDATEDELKSMQMLANGIVLTSQGLPFLHAGVDFMRTKDGDANSYKSPDAVNQLNWNDKDKYKDVYEFYKSMIAFRKEHPAFSLGDADLVREHVVFYGTEALPLEEKNVVAFLITDHAGGDVAGTIFVAYNANRTPVSIDLPAGKWSMDVYGSDIDKKPMNESFNAIDVPAIGMVVLTSQEVLKPQIIQEDETEELPSDGEPIPEEEDNTAIYINVGLLMIAAVAGVWWVRKNKKN
ncbi:MULTISPECIES: type I pullulanase [unclassified Fusibacter]|uniref:type I pullulanase n=1 Tax=unclassified Fusibacter TaxID=2624464 RepID=UPI0010137646|nr:MULTISPECIES: type I pullulanase [unclassified Fusibacter]MCK8058716.1 type I pullulanase [Fusibacter sp. A2]NPE21790.1 type I pullulanase [Fusibacter sp. A1]RXV61363.1 type I pullulanase [Fusibacter sp. A1]